MSERAKRIANECVGWFSQKLTRAEAELEITKIIEREMITISISDIHAIGPCEHGIADDAKCNECCSLPTWHELRRERDTAERRRDAARREAATAWRAEKQVAAERDEARKKLANLEESESISATLLLNHIEALAQRDRRIAELEVANAAVIRRIYQIREQYRAIGDYAAAEVVGAISVSVKAVFIDHGVSYQDSARLQPATSHALAKVEHQCDPTNTYVCTQCNIAAPPSPAAPSKSMAKRHAIMKEDTQPTTATKCEPVPRRSFAHEDPNAPPSAERIEYAEKRAAYLGELLDWKAPPTREAVCETCGKRRGFNSLCSSEFHCCVDCVWDDGVCLEMCERCAKLDAYFKAELAESNPACQK